MALVLVTAPSGTVVSTADLRDHCRVDGPDDDALIAGLQTAAVDYVEAFTHRALLTQTWDDKRDGWPCDGDGAIWLPKPPVSAITSITYTASDGTSTTWSSSLYTTDLPTGPRARAARIVPAYSESYPSLRNVPNCVVIRFVCGYGAASSVPPMIIACIKEHVRANYGRGSEDRKEILDWINNQLWSFKAF